MPQGAGGLVHHHVHVSVHLEEDLLAHPTLEEVQIVKLSAKFRESFTIFKVMAYSLLQVPRSTFTLKNLFKHYTLCYQAMKKTQRVNKEKALVRAEYQYCKNVTKLR